MNIMQAMQMIQGFRNNPQQILQQYGIPQTVNSPEEAAQYLLNNGRVTQAQINQASTMYQQLFGK